MVLKNSSSGKGLEAPWRIAWLKGQCRENTR
jgi:hypothetical protein